MACLGSGNLEKLLVENYVYINELYDIYKELFTEKQKKYFEDYFFENHSLQEISQNYDISRSAVHKQINESIKKLEDYEKKLGFYNKKNMLLSKVDDDKIKQIISEVMEG